MNFKNHLVQALYHGQGHLPLDQVAQSPASLPWTLPEMVRPHLPWAAFQCLTTIIGKKFFLISNLNLTSFSLKPLPLVLLLHLSYKSPLSTGRLPWRLSRAFSLYVILLLASSRPVPSFPEGYHSPPVSAETLSHSQQLSAHSHPASSFPRV